MSVKGPAKSRTKQISEERSNGVFHILMAMLNGVGFGFEVGKPPKTGERLVRLVVTKIVHPGGQVLFDINTFQKNSDGFRMYHGEMSSEEKARCSTYRRSFIYETLLRLVRDSCSGVSFQCPKPRKRKNFCETRVNAVILDGSGIVFAKNDLVENGRIIYDYVLRKLTNTHTIEIEPFALMDVWASLPAMGNINETEDTPRSLSEAPDQTAQETPLWVLNGAFGTPDTPEAADQPTFEIIIVTAQTSCETLFENITQ